MVALLKGLLGKTPRPIIVNGKLLYDSGSLVTAFLQNYTVQFHLHGTDKDISARSGEALLENQVQEFEQKYKLQERPNVSREVEAAVDNFTGAVLIESPRYKDLLQPSLHKADAQFMPNIAKVIRDFVVDYTFNYYDIYMTLFNRRIASPYMPMKIRGHLVSGLFQPLVVETEGIISPLKLNGNQWLLQRFKDKTVILSNRMDSRKITLTCAPMCEIASVLGVPVITELDRRDFMFMLVRTLIGRQNVEVAGQFDKKYGAILRNLQTDPVVHANQAIPLTQNEVRLRENQRHKLDLLVALTNAAINQA